MLIASHLVDHSRGSAYVEVAQRLAVLFAIEARIFTTLRVRPLCPLHRSSQPSAWS